MDTQLQQSGVVNFYTLLKSHLELWEYGHGIIDIPTPPKMKNHLNCILSDLFTIMADDKITTIMWSIRDLVYHNKKCNRENYYIKYIV